MNFKNKFPFEIPGFECSFLLYISHNFTPHLYVPTPINGTPANFQNSFQEHPHSPQVHHYSYPLPPATPPLKDLTVNMRQVNNIPNNQIKFRWSGHFQHSFVPEPYVNKIYTSSQIFAF